MTEHYTGYRYPKPVIGYAVFLDHHFRLSLRDVSELLAGRDVVVAYETTRTLSIEVIKGSTIVLRTVINRQEKKSDK